MGDRAAARRLAGRAAHPEGTQSTSDARTDDRRSGRLLFLIAVIVLAIIALAILANAFGVGPWGGAGSQPDRVLEQPAAPGGSPVPTMEADAG